MEIGHLTWAPTLEGPALAQEDERFGFDIRYFGDNTWMTPTCSPSCATRRAPLDDQAGLLGHQHPDPASFRRGYRDRRRAGGLGQPRDLRRRQGRLGGGGDRRGATAPPALPGTVRDAPGIPAGRDDRAREARSRLEWLERFDYTPVPLEIVATGPRMLRAAAALADRITINVGAAPERISWALEQVDAGLEAAAGRGPSHARHVRHGGRGR